MSDLYRYGALDPVYFVLVDSTGARLAGHAFVATDAWLIVDGGTDIDISAECVHVSKGLYKWTPSATSRTLRQVISLLITDSGGTTFIDNAINLITGGDPAARLDGT